MELTEEQRYRIYRVLLDHDTDCYFFTPRPIESYVADIVAIVEGHVPSIDDI